ncbi:hypothetical protein J2Z21_008120 [Streptomyces griseochromogenes]|uniref:LysR substrate-binding domain-containing protein n=1 Tax=Streptomyces griseochromogenes TaxID=68214 RepID=A0A1B1B3S4_9ACTN|nr:hypothetical protein [Streptomyces griseochromogenes]ANP53411.1 hypothetical protein AVL59_31205 [Streptomyces griseochromogenes]MBP2055107.1 hypothetical protein [Streptomyces griseochromogenes]
MALVPAAHPLAGHAELSASELSTTGLLTWPHQINSGLCDRLLSAFHIGGADLRIIPLTGPSTTADQVVLTPTEPSDIAAALRDLLLHASAESPSTDHSRRPQRLR